MNYNLLALCGIAVLVSTQTKNTDALLKTIRTSTSIVHIYLNRGQLWYVNHGLLPLLPTKDQKLHFHYTLEVPFKVKFKHYEPVLVIFMVSEGKIKYESFVKDTAEHRSEFVHALVPEA